MGSKDHDLMFFFYCRQELEEVRQEILSLSEKYSYKCVETASLEEQLKLATHQAKQSQQMVQKLEQRLVISLLSPNYFTSS